jgi:DNA-binding SARP family transcriptional activator
MNDQLSILALGGLIIECGGERVTGFASRKVEALLLYLALERRQHAREVLAEFLWPDRSQSQSLANLRATLNSLRQQLSPYVTILHESVSVNLDIPLWLDTHEFETQLSRASQGDGGHDTETITGALALYRGDFLEGFHIASPAFENWAYLERERLRYRAMEALDILIAHDLEAGYFAQGIARATRLLKMDALREKKPSSPHAAPGTVWAANRRHDAVRNLPPSAGRRTGG